MQFTPIALDNLSALGAFIFVFLVTAWWGIPALFAYLKQKDEEHRKDVMKLIDDAREERETFYKSLGSIDVKLGGIQDQLNQIKTSVSQKQP